MHHAGYSPVAGVTTEAGWLRCKLDLAEEPSVTNIVLNLVTPRAAAKLEILFNKQTSGVTLKAALNQNNEV